LVASLLVHAAKIDDSYTDYEKKIILKALIDLKLTTPDESEKLLKKAELKEQNSNQIIEFTASINGTKHHILVYGLFDNSDLARAEIEKLPQKARQIKPWARTVQSINDLIK